MKWQQGNKTLNPTVNEEGIQGFRRLTENYLCDETKRSDTSTETSEKICYL